jgi:hypothetical protein
MIGFIIFVEGLVVQYNMLLHIFLLSRFNLSAYKLAGVKKKSHGGSFVADEGFFKRI